MYISISNDFLVSTEIKMNFFAVMFVNVCITVGTSEDVKLSLNLSDKFDVILTVHRR